MNFKRTAMMVGGAAVLAAWLAGAATSKRTVPPPIVTPPQAIDARGLELTSEVARLRDRLHPTVVPAEPRRNLFTFKSAARISTALSVPPPPSAAVEPADARPAEPVLKLAGVAEDSGPDGPDRTAIISGQGQLFMVKVGEQVTPRYRVAKIAADAVELADLETGAARRLAMR
jgi:hypothetical protein